MPSQGLAGSEQADLCRVCGVSGRGVAAYITLCSMAANVFAGSKRCACAVAASDIEACIGCRIAEAGSLSIARRACGNPARPLGAAYMCSAPACHGRARIENARTMLRRSNIRDGNSHPSEAAGSALTSMHNMAIDTDVLAAGSRLPMVRRSFLR